MIKAGYSMLNFENLLIATSNPHKLGEFRHLLSVLSCKILAPQEIGCALPSVDETGETLRENARLKAACWAKIAQQWALADDTGLEVDALGGLPGVRSARYAGDKATMAENREKLLNELKRCGHLDRTARFKCVLALSDPNGEIVHEATGICEGEVLETPAGAGGFGYDSLFWVAAAGKTLAEMDLAETAKHSHRGQAVRQLLKLLSRSDSRSDNQSGNDS